MPRGPQNMPQHRLHREGLAAHTAQYFSEEVAHSDAKRDPAFRLQRQLEMDLSEPDSLPSMIFS
jgi:hypothetical protein